MVKDAFGLAYPPRSADAADVAAASLRSPRVVGPQLCACPLAARMLPLQQDGASPAHERSCHRQ